MLNDEKQYDENILFYTILKKLVQLKLTKKELEDFQIILLRNKNLSFNKLAQVTNYEIVCHLQVIFSTTSKNRCNT